MKDLESSSNYSPTTLVFYDAEKERNVYHLDIQPTNEEKSMEYENPGFSTLRKPSIYMFYQKKDIIMLLIATISTIISALSPAVSSILLGRVFNVLSDLSSGKYTTYQESLRQITLSAMSFLALGAGTMIAVWITITCWMKLGELHGIRARRHMLKTFLKKPVSWYEANEQLMGDLTQMNRCVEELRAGNSLSTALVIQNIVSIIALLGTSFYYSWSVTLIMLASTPLIIVAALGFSKLIERYTKRENEKTSIAAKIFDWSLTSSKLVRLFQTQELELMKFGKVVNDCKSEFIRLSIVVALHLGTMRFLILCMFVQGFWFGSSEIKKGRATTGDVLTCFTSCLMVGECIKSMLPQLIVIQKADVAIRRVQGLIQLQKTDIMKTKFNQIINLADSRKISIYPGPCKGDIKFKNVDFSYPTRPNLKVLKSVNIHFPAGRTTFLIGRSGSGKSTLSSLLLNFYKPSKGRVELDGFDVSDLNSIWLTDNITVVEQTCTIFNDTLRNNILIGKSTKSTSDNETDDAIRLSLLREVIRDLDRGLDTIVGPNGVSLSGGQQQRVAIARAKVRDTPILILDESVSALDIVLRELIIEAIKIWRRGKTTIILTHELSQIDKDDYVYLMENGEVQGFGFRRDLEKVSRFFNKLTSLQDSTIAKINHHEFEFKPTNNDISRLSANVFSRFIRSMYATKENENIFDFEISNELTDRQIGRRTNRKSLKDDDLETGIEEKGKRPELMGIIQIVKKMMITVRRKFILFLAILASVLNGTVNPVFSYCFSKLLTGIVPQSDSNIGSSSYLLQWSLIVIFLALFDGVSTFLKEFLLNYSAELWIFDLRKKVFKVISEQGIKWFSEDSNNASEINTLVLNDSRDLRSLISHFLGVISTVTVLALLGMVWALVKGWKLSLVCISLIPLFIIASSLYAGLLQTSENEYKNAVAELETHLYEIVKGIKTIKVLRLNGYFQAKFEEKVDSMNNIANKRALFTGMGVALTNMLTYVVQGILLYYGMKLVAKQEYSINQLMVTYTLLLFSIMSSFQLMTQIPDISRGQRAGSYIFRLLELQPSTTETEGKIIPFVTTNNMVTFENVDFNYPSNPQHKVLKKLSFNVRVSEHVAIVGESGSGKSTITLLLNRLYEIASNSVYFQGVDINNIDIRYLRSKISLVDQHAKFFDGSILENITYGLKSYTKNDVIDALKLANIYEFVLSLPNGLNSRIDSSLISGGQAQRLSVARALIHKPRLVIFDESTSALDPENTFKIAQLIQKNLKGVSVIIITHSEYMMKIADRIITLKRGSVCEDGTYEELFDKHGEFYRIVSAGVPS